MPIRWERFTEGFCATLRMPQWEGHLQVLSQKGKRLRRLNSKINFFRPVRNAELKAEAKVIHKGKTVGFMDCEVRDEKDKLVAKASSSCMALAGTKAAGR